METWSHLQTNNCKSDTEKQLSMVSIWLERNSRIFKDSFSILDFIWDSYSFGLSLVFCSRSCFKVFLCQICREISIVYLQDPISKIFLVSFMFVCEDIFSSLHILFSHLMKFLFLFQKSMQDIPGYLFSLFQN